MNKKSQNFFNYSLPSFGDILWMVTFFAVLLRGHRIINADGDLLLHLNLGHYILGTGKIPLKDIFSHTLVGQPVTQHEWLTAVIFEGLNRLFELNGVVFFCALIISTTVYLNFRFLQKKYQTLLPVLFSSLLILLNSMIHWFARPHILTFLLLTLWMIILDKLKTGKIQRWWILPLIMLFWVNLHGGFIIGFITWLISGVGLAWDWIFDGEGDEQLLPPQFWKKYLLAGGASFLISLLNPSGIGLWTKVVSHAGNKYLADITNEFQSPNFHESVFIPFLVTIGVLIIVLGSTPKKFRSDKLFNTGAWLILSLYSIRNIPLFGIAAAPLLAEGINETLFIKKTDNKLINWIQGVNSRLDKLNRDLKGFLWPIFSILIVIIGLATGVKFDIDQKGYTLDPAVFPVDAVNWLEDNSQEGEMFNYFTWGGYLEYRLWPEKKVFIDSKSDFYGEDFVRGYGKVILQQEGWEEVLEKYGVDWAILPVDEIAAEALEEELGWKIVFQDETTVILERK